MSLARLLKAVPPPADPEENAGAWASTEKKLGLNLPADYKQLIEAYGSGQFMDFMIVFNPFSKNASIHLLKSINGQLKADRMSRQDVLELEEEDYPFPLFPESGGLLPCGRTFNGDRLYWQTKGSPNKWPIVAWESRGPRNALYKVALTDFLVQWMTGGLKCSFFPKRDRHAKPDFTPFRIKERVNVHIGELDVPFDDQLAKLRRHFDSPRIKRRHRSATFNQCVFLAGMADTEVLFQGQLGHGTSIQIDYPKKEQKEIKEFVRTIEAELGWRVHGVFKSVGDYGQQKPVWEDLLQGSRKRRQ